jgi:hypothetical protein
MARKVSKRQQALDAWFRYRLAHNMANSSSLEWLKMDIAREAFFAGVKVGQRVERTTAKRKDH